MKRILTTLLLAFLIVSFIGVNDYAQAAEPMPVRTLIPEIDNTYDAGTDERRFREVKTNDLEVVDDATVGDDLTVTGSVIIGGVTLVQEKVKQFNPMDFGLEDDLEITASTTPGYEEDNNAQSIVWADGETSSVLVTFRVPEDYASGGAFRACIDGSGTSTKNQVDFNVYVTTPGAAWDSSATNQTPVARTLASGSPEMVALTVATDFASLAAGDIVVLRLWRDDTANGTDDMELFYAEFYYD